MDTNTVIAAPASVDVETLFEKWKQSHSGSLATFYEFMTTPTIERELFLNSCTSRTVHNSAAIVLYS